MRIQIKFALLNKIGIIRGYSMRQCALCKKGSKMVGSRRLLRGHYNPVNWSRKYPNLQWAKIGGKRIKICTQCLRSAHRAKKAK